MAGLPDNRARVGVGPPLFCSGPSIGSIRLKPLPTWLPFTPFTRLLPSPLPTKQWSAVGPVLEAVLRSGEPFAVFPATMVLIRGTLEPESTNKPPPLALAPPIAWLSAIVQLVSVAVLERKRPP